MPGLVPPTPTVKVQPTRVLMGKLRHRVCVSLSVSISPPPHSSLHGTLCTALPVRAVSHTGVQHRCTLRTHTHTEQQHHLSRAALSSLHRPLFPLNPFPLVPQSLSLAGGRPGIPLHNLLLSFANYSKYSRRAHTQQGRQAGASQSPSASPSTQRGCPPPTPLLRTFLCLSPSPTPPPFLWTDHSAKRTKTAPAFSISLWDQPSALAKVGTPWLTVGRVTACPGPILEREAMSGASRPAPWMNTRPKPKDAEQNRRTERGMPLAALDVHSEPFKILMPMLHRGPISPES